MISPLLLFKMTAFASSKTEIGVSFGYETMTDLRVVGAAKTYALRNANSQAIIESFIVRRLEIACRCSCMTWIVLEVFESTGMRMRMKMRMRMIEGSLTSPSLDWEWSYHVIGYLARAKPDSSQDNTSLLAFPNLFIVNFYPIPPSAISVSHKDRAPLVDTLTALDNSTVRSRSVSSRVIRNHRRPQPPCFRPLC